MGYNENDNQFGNNQFGGYNQPTNDYNQPTNDYNQSTNEYNQNANQFAGYGQPSNDFSQPSNDFSQPTNDFSQSTNDFNQNTNQFGADNSYNNNAYGTPNDANNAYGANAYGTPNDANNAYGANAYGTPNDANNAYGANAYGTNDYGANGAYNNQPAFTPYQQPEKSGDGLGIASLIMGIGSLTCLLSILSVPGLICGIVGKVKKKDSKVALAGIITSAIGLVFLILILAIGVPTYLATKKAVTTISNELEENADTYSDIYEDALNELSTELDEYSDAVDEYTDALDDTTDATDSANAATPASSNEMDGIHFTLNDVGFTIGESKPADFAAGLGYTFDQEDLDYVLNSNEYSYLKMYFDDDISKAAYIYFANYSDEALPISECVLYRIDVEASGYTSGNMVDFCTLDIGGINNYTSEADFLSIMGETEDIYESDEYNLKEYTYYSKFDGTNIKVIGGFNESGCYELIMGYY